MTISQAAQHPDITDGHALFPPASLGVIGSGQLGRMFIQAAQRMGYRAGVLGTTAETPAAQVANWTVIGPPDHLPALRTFAESSRGRDRRVRECVGPRAAVAGAPARGAPGVADPLDLPEPAAGEALSGPTQIPHAPWRPVRGEDELDQAVRSLGLPLDPQDGRFGL